MTLVVVVRATYTGQWGQASPPPNFMPQGPGSVKIGDMSKALMVQLTVRALISLLIASPGLGSRVNHIESPTLDLHECSSTQGLECSSFLSSIL